MSRLGDKVAKGPCAGKEPCLSRRQKGNQRGTESFSEHAVLCTKEERKTENSQLPLMLLKQVGV